MLNFRTMSLLAMIYCCGFIGCQQDESLPATTPVKGSVAFQNQPAIGAVVVFHKVDGSILDGMPSATVGADGTFELTSYKPGDGAPPGEYEVSISWAEKTSGTSSDPEFGPEKLPAKYQDEKQSGLKVIVGDSSIELPPFQL